MEHGLFGRNAHKLRAFDQKRGVANEGDAHLVGIERSNLKRGRNDARPVARNQSGAVFRRLRR
ncbi:MAG: hypothetical protein WBE48_18630 [Xanthobacteraceae bacterium]